jgi:hypothetical protein
VIVAGLALVLFRPARAQFTQRHHTLTRKGEAAPIDVIVLANEGDFCRANSSTPSPRLRLTHSAPPHHGSAPAAHPQAGSIDSNLLGPLTGAHPIQRATIHRGLAPPTRVREQSIESNTQASPGGVRHIATPCRGMLPLICLHDQPIDSDFLGSPAGACPTELATPQFGAPRQDLLQEQAVEFAVPPSPLEAHPFQSANPHRGLLPPAHVRASSIETTSSLSSVNSMSDPFVKQEDNSSFHMSQLPEPEKFTNRRSTRLCKAGPNEYASFSSDTVYVTRSEDRPQHATEPEETEAEKQRRIRKEYNPVSLCICYTADDDCRKRRLMFQNMGFKFNYETVHCPE